jgi:RsiW-degrading membrane proteinase PrsW (M82 family)
MIEAKCQCGASLDVPESFVGRAATCGVCGGVLNFVAAEPLAEGAGGGDFDARLIVTAGPMRAGEQFFLGGVVDVALGKSPDRHISLPGGKLVSRQHAKLVRLDFGPSRWGVEDTNSTNGVFVNEQRVTGSRELRDGDAIRVGEYELRYNVAAPAAEALAAPEAAASAHSASAPLGRYASVLESSGAGGSRSYRDLVYFILLLALIPLAVSMLRGEEDSVGARLERTFEQNPGVQERVESLSDEASMGDFLSLFPDGRIEGALLSHDTYAHWGFAAAAAALFFLVLVGLFPRGTAPATRLLVVGVFTATIGILFLLAVQYIADWTYGRIVYGRSILVLFFYVAKFIGFSYRAALDPETNFFVSCFGFTFGVGMCEELVKALPLIVHYTNKAEWSWRGACLVGLASGVGFGVSEGVTYSSDYYNGLLGADVYLVRFISCVALHAIWSGAAGIFIYKQQGVLQGAESFWGVAGAAIVLVSVPMVLHGVYDTLLKKDYEVLALVTAVVSFAWFAWQIETARRTFDEQESGTALATA